MKSRFFLMFCAMGLSLYANDDRCECPPMQGEILSDQYCPAYNKEAAIAVKHKLQRSLGDATFFFDVSFTYWYISQEGLRLATNGVLNGSNLLSAVNTTAYFPSFSYEPGFKFGIGGVVCDEWQYRGEYTWVHTNVKGGNQSLPVNETTPAGSTIVSSGASVFSLDDWFLQGSSLGQAIAASSIASHWTLNMNLVDLTVGRPYYQGRDLTISPFSGLEIAVISQKLNLSLTEPAGQFSGLPYQPISSQTSYNSWGIGPTVGFNGSYLLPGHFRLEGNGAFNLLYTTYTTIEHSEDPASVLFNNGPYTVQYTDYRAVRPNASLELGLGWGQYMQDGDTHIDLSATYEFAVYWAQNMMRKLLDDTLTGTSPATGDLFTQGLTLTGRFDF